MGVQRYRLVCFLPKFSIYFFIAFGLNFNLFSKNLSPLFMRGGKDNVVAFISQFLLPFLSTFHSSLIHILRTILFETGGKDRSSIVPAKCFLKAKTYKRLNRF